MEVPGRNVVVTNRSSKNHGRPATLKVSGRRGAVRLVHGMNGGNEYGIDLERDDALADLVAELIRYCPRKAAPLLLHAVGEVLVSDESS